MPIFLTGATGYIGSAVLDAILKGGHQVTAIARDPASGVYYGASESRKDGQAAGY